MLIEQSYLVSIRIVISLISNPNISNTTRKRTTYVELNFILYRSNLTEPELTSTASHVGLGQATEGEQNTCFGPFQNTKLDEDVVK